MQRALTQIEYHLEKRAVNAVTRVDLQSFAEDLDAWAACCDDQLNAKECFDAWQGAGQDNKRGAIAHAAALALKLNLARRSLGIFLYGANLSIPYLGQSQADRVHIDRCPELLTSWFDSLSSQCRAFEYDKPLPAWGARFRRHNEQDDSEKSQRAPEQMFTSYSDECARRILVEFHLGEYLISLTDQQDDGSRVWFEIAASSTSVSRRLRLEEADAVLDARRKGLDSAIDTALRSVSEEQRELWEAWQEVVQRKQELTDQIEALNQEENELSKDDDAASQTAMQELRMMITKLETEHAALSQDQVAEQVARWRRARGLKAKPPLSRSAVSRRLIPIQRRIVEAVAAWLIRHESVATASIPNLDVFFQSQILINSAERNRLVAELRRRKREAGEPEAPTPEEIATAIAATVRAANAKRQKSPMVTSV